MGLFTEKISNPYCIFQRKEALGEDYVPETIRGFPAREKEINRLVECLKPVLKGERINVVVYGPQGCGKSSVLSFVLNSLAKETNSKAIFIDCWHHNSPQAVLHMVGLEFGTLKIARRGISTSERIYKLNRTYIKKPTIVALDDAERLLSRNPSVIMDLIKINKLSLILILNNPQILDKTEPKIMSCLHPYQIQFNPYTLEQIEDILRERISIAFDSGSIKGDLLKAVSEFTFLNGGDIRLGLNALLKTGQEALNQGSEFVDLTHFEKVKKDLNCLKWDKSENLNQHEKDIIAVLREKNLQPEELYGQYEKSCANPLGQRQFYIYLNRMLAQGLIKSGRGKTKIKRGYGVVSLNECR